MTEKEALKLALEALKYPLNQSHENFNVDMAELLAHRAITAIKEALAEQPAQQDSTCSNALRIQHKAYPRTCKKCGLGPCVELAQQALDKKAENARELGLDYEPAQQQEPLFWYRPCSNGMYEGPIHNAQIERIRKESGAWHPLYTSPPAQQQEPVATDWERIARVQNAKLMAVCDESEGFKKLCEVMDRYERTSPPAQRTWVGLTDAETKHFWEISRAAIPRYHTFKILIEKALRERNT